MKYQVDSVDEYLAAIRAEKQEISKNCYRFKFTTQIWFKNTAMNRENRMLENLHPAL